MSEYVHAYLKFAVRQSYNYARLAIIEAKLTYLRAKIDLYLWRTS